MNLLQSNATNRWKGLLLSVFFLSSAPAGASELYTEQTYLSREQVVSSHIQLKTFFAQGQVLTPYVEIGNEWMAPAKDPFAYDGGSYFHVGTGLRFSLAKVSLFVEGRYRRFFRESGRERGEFRSLLVAGDFFQWASWTAGIRPFAELYSETLFTTADNVNVVTANYARLGLRRSWGRFHTDLFVEPFVTLDRVGHFYNNRADAKLTLRAVQPIGSLTASLMASYLVNQYFSFGNFEPNPHSNKVDGFRVLLTVGGEL